MEKKTNFEDEEEMLRRAIAMSLEEEEVVVTLQGAGELYCRFEYLVAR